MACKKIAHETHASAKRHQKGLMKKGRVSRKYRCPHCGFLHITTKVK